MHHQPILARDKTAAKLLDMTLPEFRRLVDAGSLPGPVQIGGMDRWPVDQLQAVVTGKAALPKQEFEL